MVIRDHSYDDYVYAKENDSRFQRALLIDLINHFGSLGGFETFISSFRQSQSLTMPQIYSLLKPFIPCIELFTTKTVETYFQPILEIVPPIIENLTDKELKSEIKSIDHQTKSDYITIIIKFLRSIARRLSDFVEIAKLLELLRLKILIRLLQISSFNGKMNALNELNKVITAYSNETSPGSLTNLNEVLLSSEQMAQWLIENKVLEIVLKDCLHQPQYVEKLENIIRFLIKKNTLSLYSLDMIWNSQIEKHEIIVKNVHDLIAKLAWSFSSDQLNHLFACFESSWSSASKKEREKLLELMRRLAEDDKDGSMAHKVLSLLWDIAYSDELDIDIIDQALTCHFKILDYGRTYDKDAQKVFWLKRCIAELDKPPNIGNNVLSAMKHIREICKSFPTNSRSSPTLNPKPIGVKVSNHKLTNRHEVLTILQDQYSFVASIANNLSNYMDYARQIYMNGQDDPNQIPNGRRFTHLQEVQERLNFLKFVLQDGQLWLCLSQACEIWNCLTRKAVFPIDIQICFRWFTSLIDSNSETDLDPETFGQFFELNILKLDPTLVNIDGIECFQKFFQTVNCQESRLIMRNGYFMNNNDLIGIDYLLTLIYFCDDEAAGKAVNLLIESYTNLGPNLLNAQVELHFDLINTCFDRLRASYDTVSVIKTDPTQATITRNELQKMTRLLRVLYEYIFKCDNDFTQERTILPMSQSYRGKQVSVSIKILNFGRNTDDLELWTHTNESLTAIRKKILTKLKLMHNVDLEFCCMGEKIDLSIVKLVSHIPFTDKLILTARLIHSNTNISSSGMDYHDFKINSLVFKQEENLPGVIMSKKANYFLFLFKLADIGMSLGNFPLQEMCLSLLKLIPPDVNMVNFMKNFCKNSISNHGDLQQPEQVDPKEIIENELFSSPTKTVYLLGIIYSLLFPTNNPLSDDSQEFQKSFITSKCALRILEYLNVKQSFLAQTDNFYKICAISIILKISKFILSTLSYLKMFCLKSSTNLNEALHLAPKDFILRKISMNTAQNIYNEKFNNQHGELLSQNLSEVLNYNPNMELISSILSIAFATATGSFSWIDSNYKSIHQYFLLMEKQEKIDPFVDSNTENSSSAKKIYTSEMFDCHEVCKESIEVLTIIFMLSPNDLRSVIDNHKWQNFFIDVLLICDELSIRSTVMEQFTLIITKCVQNQDILNSSIQLMFQNLKEFVPKFYRNSGQFFQLFCNLLEYAYQSKCSIQIVNDLLCYEIDMLKNARKNFIQNGILEEIQLEGHLKICKELIMLLSPDEKCKIGTQNEVNFIDFILDEFIFTASKSLCLLQNNVQDIEEIDPICSTSASLIAAYELLVALCTECAENLGLLNQSLDNYFNNLRVPEWEYFPFMGTRPIQSFVGLKNAGATCYMNSVLQQLFMIPEIREGVLSVNTNSNYSFTDDILNEEPPYLLPNVSTAIALPAPQYFSNNQIQSDEAQDSESYNIGILKQLQIIFGHLLLSKCQYYVPKGFWQQFKLYGGTVNLREQHDALEFFNSLVDSLDEAQKSLKQTPIMSHVFGGTFADQKICKSCPHRYSREESFTTLNVDVRNHNSLCDSLEQYVKGDLLEGDNAYHCEKCDRKVDTVKRLCIKRLPKVLAIQLKRFDYDYERETAIKFNDYFEFPRILDMQPYTVNGLAQIEGEVIEEDLSIGTIEDTQYELNGIVVHSGQASGGHYYSFIQHKNQQTGKKSWYKFDDGDVNECKLDEDEEMRNQCFGGEYIAETFDQSLKRMSHRTQKRWWNAFILIYRKITVDSPLEMDSNHLPTKIEMPSSIKRNVQHQNIRFLHQRNQFSEEFYYFMKRIIHCNIKPTQIVSSNQNENGKLDLIIYTTLNLASRFLFFFCFRTKKSLRNNAMEWYDDLISYLKASCSVRLWFLEKCIFQYPNLICELLLECPAADVRQAFSKLIVFLSHYALIDKDNPCNNPNPGLYADRIMESVTCLLKKDLSEYSNNLTQYFNMFYLFTTLGVKERAHLLKFDVPFQFMSIATDEGTGYPIKYQYVEFGKLYQVVSLLIRCCNISDHCSSFNADRVVSPNPFRHEEISDYIQPLPLAAYEILFVKKKYLKKIIKDAHSLEDTCKLLQFCCWENPNFSLSVLNEIIYYITNAYTYELRPYFDLLYHLLMMPDSWQEHRIRTACIGDNPNWEGLFDLMQNHTDHPEKRVYQCIKFLSNLFIENIKASSILNESNDLKLKWKNATMWLRKSLNYPSSTPSSYFQYNNNPSNNNNTNNWSTAASAMSNETSNSYVLERSNSAAFTLNRAEELLVCEESQLSIETEVEDVTDENEIDVDTTPTLIEDQTTEQPLLMVNEIANLSLQPPPSSLTLAKNESDIIIPFSTIQKKDSNLDK
ncbi:putative ubiquitin carboxyl-terminal hydrolase FAF-X [Blomia tropicalis]|nr:putative ubiquitin carboxyl-terminal hydrolase FAF-X [Blomia tropicalis]